MMTRRYPRLQSISRRLGAGLLAAGTLWGAAVTAGSDTASGAWASLRDSASLGLLRWELGDLRPRDSLSPAAVLTLGQSPLLLSNRSRVAELRSQDRPEDPVLPEAAVPPPEPAPTAPADAPPDNGVTPRTLVPKDPSGYAVVGRAYISNSTDHALDLADFDGLFAAELTEGEPQILILHTHGSEAYTPAPGTDVVWSGDRRTTDSRCNVLRVGDEMAAVFSAAGISVLHDRTLYDYPNYKGSYDRSLAAVQSYLAQYPSISFILDIHRDAIQDRQGNEYKVLSPIEGLGNAAQLTLVVGSDGSGKPHPRWLENLKFAVALQQNILERYPTLMRPLLLRNSRYNQHVSPGALLVEVGAAGNAPEEAVLGGRLLAQQMAEVLEGRSK